MNNRILGTILMGASLALGVVMLPEAASAQGTLRYQTRYSKSDVARIIAKLEASADAFRGDFDRAMDRSNIDGTSTEDRYNEYVKNFDDALERVRGDFDRRDSWWDARSNVQNAIQRAQPVNEMMNTISFRRNLERQWNTMRNDLNALADTFDLPGLNGGGWMGGNSGWNGGNNASWGGGRRGEVPTWALGTFYGRSRAGDNVVLTVSQDGTVMVAINGGNPTYASMYRTTLTNGQYVSRLTKRGNGFRTTSVDNNDYIDYSRTPSNNGNWNNGGNWGGGQQGNVPSWAVGTFYGRSRAGDNVVLNVSQNGTVMVAINGGEPTYASMNGTTLTNGQYVSRVTQRNNGFRTTSVDNNDYIDYSRTAGDGGNWNNGGNYGGQQGNVPTWAVGTFYGRARTGENVVLTIARNGSVSVAINGGSPTYASMNGTTLTNGQYVSNVTQLRNGIRTTSVTNNDSIDYYRR